MVVFVVVVVELRGRGFGVGMVDGGKVKKGEREERREGKIIGKGI